MIPGSGVGTYGSDAVREGPGRVLMKKKKEIGLEYFGEGCIKIQMVSGERGMVETLLTK